jgi:hypothetical protein
MIKGTHYFLRTEGKRIEAKAIENHETEIKTNRPSKIKPKHANYTQDNSDSKKVTNFHKKKEEFQPRKV